MNIRTEWILNTASFSLNEVAAVISGHAFTCWKGSFVLAQQRKWDQHVIANKTQRESSHEKLKPLKQTRLTKAPLIAFHKAIFQVQIYSKLLPAAQ